MKTVAAVQEQYKLFLFICWARMFVYRKCKWEWVYVHWHSGLFRLFDLYEYHMDLGNELRSSGYLAGCLVWQKL